MRGPGLEGKTAGKGALDCSDHHCSEPKALQAREQSEGLWRGTYGVGLRRRSGPRRGGGLASSGEMQDASGEIVRVWRSMTADGTGKAGDKNCDEGGRSYE